MRTLESRGVELRSVAAVDGLGHIDQTSRTKRVYAAEGEECAPYLRPYDVFDYLPQAADFLSVNGSTGIKQLIPPQGTILQTCSGRNLGPLAYADAFISRFVVSDDMLRVHIENEADRFYTLAFLSSPTGQALLTRNKTGNVIDHLSAGDLAAVSVPVLKGDVWSSVVTKMRRAVAAREAARIRLDELRLRIESQLPSPVRGAALRNGWTQSSAALNGRLDAAFHDPLVHQIRAELRSSGGIRVGDVAKTSMPNRYKRVYVAADNGRPILSGRQLLQTLPINLQYINESALDFTQYELREGTVAFGARGRAEDRIAQPALITSDRADWLASHNVMRVRANPGISPGWLYLCFATWQVQAQVAATAFGSVVDVVDPSNLDDVLLPAHDSEIGAEAFNCWEALAAANGDQASAIDELERAVGALSS